MSQKFLSLAVIFLASVSFIRAQTDTLPLLFNRQIVSMPELPLEAANSGLRGRVRISLIVDADGNVVEVGKASGPGSICEQVTRPDVVAVRNAIAETAKLVKYSPVKDGEPKLARTWFEVELVGAEEEAAEIISAHAEPPADEMSKSVKPRDPDKFTVRGVVNSKASLAGADYTGPVAVADKSETAKDEKHAAVPAGNYSASPTPAVGEAATAGSRTISGGVLNGKAEHLSRPFYPPAARAVRAAGAVSVQVIIDETGEMFSAQAVSGHPLLRSAAVIAACQSKFSPTLLQGHPVRVAGIITYNFVP